MGATSSVYTNMTNLETKVLLKSAATALVNQWSPSWIEKLNTLADTFDETDDDDRDAPCPNCKDGELEFSISSDETYSGQIVPEAEIIGSTCGCVLNHVQISIACERAERNAADFSFGED